jgi:hypothetical protein
MFVSVSVGSGTSLFSQLRISSKIRFLPACFHIQSYLKGYLHHQKQIAVLSKNLAFPRIRDVRVITERYDDAAVEAHLAAHAASSSLQGTSESAFMSMET